MIENLNYKFKDRSLLELALTHKSAKRGVNNERLEFLGDAVMDLIVAEYLCDKFKDIPEGDLSKLRAALVNEKSFAKLARMLNLGKSIIISNAEENNNGREKSSILSDAFEALMGAIYLESGLEASRKVAIELLESEYQDISLEALAKDYKTALQELTQGKFGITPEYRLLASKGPDHKKDFKMAVYLDGKLYGEAVGKSKKDGEQKAAKIAIDRLKNRG